mmetsp:Transcript_5253/g.15524  ORF Transcript_5253/g.15524 Transcript_5253/m.15524 type:complete len:283 (-) Transcript_5253:109-957(-)
MRRHRLGLAVLLAGAAVCLPIPPLFVLPARPLTVPLPVLRVPGLGHAASAPAGGFPFCSGTALAAALAVAAARALASPASGRQAKLAGCRAAAKEGAAQAGIEDEKDLPLDVDFDVELPPPKPYEPKDQVGVTAPLGFFDPLGFTKVGDRQGFRKLRAAELKHGRVAMMATVGCVVQHYARLPGFEAAKSNFASQAEVTFRAPAIYSFCVFTVCLFFLELSLWAQDEDREPGDFGDPLGIDMYDVDTRNRELNNGRFAMFAAVGIIAAQFATGKDAIQQLGL